MLRNIFAVVAGFLLWSVLWLGSNSLLLAAAASEFRADGSTESGAILVVLLALALGISIASGFVTIRVTKRKSITPALALGAILLLVGIAVQMQYWNVMPLWYHIVFLAMLVPATIYGGKFAYRGL